MLRYIITMEAFGQNFSWSVQMLGLLTQAYLVAIISINAILEVL